MSKRALVTGVCGQDGQFLSAHLAKLGYRVFGLARHGSTKALDVPQGVELLYGDMRDAASLETAVWKANPDEVYNLAGQVFVPVSWARPAETFDINTSGLARLLEITSRLKPDTRVYQASSSEMYGNQEGACDESVAFRPTSPYGVSKLAAHELVRVYRERGMFVVGGILFNHESHLRGTEMVTRKITRHVAAWHHGSDETLVLGDMDAQRDWGFAGDYVKAMHLMLQMPLAQDYVVGTGKLYSIEAFVRAAIDAAGLPAYYFDRVAVSNSLKRKNEIRRLCANADKALHELEWAPELDFEGLVQYMVKWDIENYPVSRVATAATKGR